MSIIGRVFVRKTDDGLYYLAVFGMIFGASIMVLFWYKAGLSPWVAIIYFVTYFILCLGMTRMRAELGSPTHELHNAHPDRIMVGFLGTRAIGPANLTNTTLLSWLAYGYRCHPMPHQLEGGKIGSYFNINQRRLGDCNNCCFNYRRIFVNSASCIVILQVSVCQVGHW